MKRSLCSLFALLLAAACATPLPQTPPAGAPARVDAPQVRIGEQWAYSLHDGYTKLPKGTLSHRVHAVQDDTVVVEAQREGRRSTELYTRDWTVFELVHYQQGG